MYVVKEPRMAFKNQEDRHVLDVKSVKSIYVCPTASECFTLWQIIKHFQPLKSRPSTTSRLDYIIYSILNRLCQV